MFILGKRWCLVLALAAVTAPGVSSIQCWQLEPPEELASASAPGTDLASLPPHPRLRVDDGQFAEGPLLSDGVCHRCAGSQPRGPECSFLFY